MASAYGNQVQRWRSRVVADCTAETDNTYTLRVRCYWCSVSYGYSVFANGTAYNGSQTAYAEFSARSGTGETVETLVAEKTVTYTKGDSSSSVSCKAVVNVTGGFHNGTSTASLTVTIPARVKHPPSAPSAPSVMRSGESIIATWQTNATNATGCRVQRQKSGEADPVQVYSGAVKSSHSEQPGPGSFRYRAQNYNGDGDSSWGGWSDYIQSQAAPSAPSIVSPASGSTIDSSAGTVSVSWRHNPVDGSAQTAAELRFSPDQSSWETAEVDGAASEYERSVPDNGDVYWQVRTKGTYDGGDDPESAWSPWSATGYFRTRTRPSVAVSVPEIVEELPVPVSWEYNDAMGEQASALVELLLGGEVVYQERVGADKSCQISAAEFSPANGETYTVRVTATSTTSLAGTGAASFSVDYEPPNQPEVRVAIDPAALSCEVVCYAGSGGDVPPTVAMDLYRGDALLASGLVGGELIVDSLPPLDALVEYRAVARAESGASAEGSTDVSVPSFGQAAVNWGDRFRSCFRLGLSPSYSLDREVEKSTFEAAAFPEPVASYGTHAQSSGTISGTVARDASDGAALGDFMSLMRQTGAVVVRLPGDGGRFHADASCSISSYGARSSKVSIEWEETAYDDVL